MRLIPSVLAAACGVGAMWLLYPASAADDIERKPIPVTSAADGAAMYRAYCASCHGLKGKGDGPAAQALKAPPSNLTALARYNDGVFPVFEVLAALRPDGGIHGSSEMPVWGNVFRESRQTVPEMELRAYNLTRYIESIQEPSLRPADKGKESEVRPLRVTDVRASFGGDMYRTYCASCHGIDGRGAGPAALTLKAVPTDLTKLRGPDGKFQALRVTNTLLMETVSVVHGSRDMPIWGDVFRASREDPAISRLRAVNLTRYIESMQP